jgi:hypothetical protein
MPAGGGEIVAAGALDFAHLQTLAQNKPVADAPCPLCGPDKQQRHKQTKRVLRIWLGDDAFATYSCARCGAKGHAHAGGARHRISRADIARRMRQAEAHQLEEAGKRRAKAQWLWGQAVPAAATVVEAYLAGRGITVVPPTLRFLPARGEHAPSMVAAFGFADIAAVHVTRLKPDGSGKAPDAEGRAKIMVGPTESFPLALAPPNELGGLAVAEGIETALSVHQATGLGAWAAGAAGRLARLAPGIASLSYVEAVTIFAEDDDAGRRGAHDLARELARLRRNIEVRVTGGT